MTKWKNLLGEQKLQKKYQIEILELKNTIIEIKNPVDGRWV